MDILFAMLPLLVPIAFLLYAASRQVPCPDCGETLPILYSPLTKTRRMWLSGGYLCDRCGCETNMAGEKVTADTPPAPFPVLQCALLGVLLLVGAGLAATLIIVLAAPPPMVAAPPVVDVLQPAPAVAPVN